MPAVDHSALLLDAPRMAAVLRNSLPDLRGRSLGDCRIHQSRRRISRKTEELGAPYLGVVYEIETRDAGRDPGPVLRWVYVKAYSLGASRGAAPTPPAVHLRELDALAWMLPDDPAMPHLKAFLDPDRAAAALCDALGDRGRDAPIAPAAASIVRHEPESHCMARFDLPWRGRRRCVYGKTYVDETWKACARRVRSLWQASRDADAFAIARPLGDSRDLRAVWQAPVKGTALRAQLQGPAAAEWLERVALGLRALQSQPHADGDAALTAQELLERADKQCGKLARADASLEPVLEPVLDSLRQSVPITEVSVLAHGDFHADQMLCTERRVALFDFDNFVVGSPALDVADFASQILTDADLDTRRRADLAAAFVAHCTVRLPWPPAREELEWALRALLLRKAYSFFVRHRPGWRARVLEAASLAAGGCAFLWPRRTRGALS